MFYLVQLLVPIAIGCVLPIMVIWFIIRKMMNETNKCTEIVLAVIEKNPDTDVEELMKKISPKPKLLKEKLLGKLLWGCLLTLLGVGMIGLDVYFNVSTDSKTPLGVLGVALLAIGIAFLVNYRVGKRMLASEIESEERLLASQAEGK